MSQTLDQQRAMHAWSLVQKVEPGDWDEFETQVRKLPTRILIAGLGQATAFLEAKDYAEVLRRGLAEWLHTRRPDGPEAKRVVERIVFGNSDFLRFATTEILSYAQWLVRFTEARSKDLDRNAKKAPDGEMGEKS